MSNGLADQYATYADVIRLGGDKQQALAASGLTADQATALGVQSRRGTLDRDVYPRGQTAREKALRPRRREKPSLTPAQRASLVGKYGEIEHVGGEGAPAPEASAPQDIINRWNAFRESQTAQQDEAAFRAIEQAEALNLGALPTESDPMPQGSRGMYLSTPATALESGLEGLIGRPSVSSITGKTVPGYTASKRYLTGKEIDFIKNNPDLAVERGIVTTEELAEIAGSGVNIPRMPTEGPPPESVPGGDTLDPATAGGGIRTNAGGDIVMSRGKFDRLMGFAEGALARSRKAGLEAAGGVDYQAQAEAMAQEQGRMREQYNREMREYEALQGRQQLALDRVEGEMRLAEEDLQNGTVDPNRAYGGLGGRVAAAFAMALGAFAQGLSGGKTQNTAFKIIQGAINRDMLAQKEELNKRRDVLRNKNNIYAHMMKRFGDARMAEQATINMGLNVAKMKIQELATRFKGTQQEAAADQMISAIEGKAAEGYAKLAQLEMQRLTREDTIKRGKGDDAKNLFGQALAEVGHLREKFKAMGKGEAAWSHVVGWFGPETQVTFSADEASQYAAARFAVAQFVNKAFSGARGSDRDLAAVMARIPTAGIRTINSAKGLKLIKNLEYSLKRAAGEKGYLEKGDIANYYDKNEDGGKGLTDTWQLRFQSEIDRVQGRGAE